MISFVIPSRAEQLLARTIRSANEASKGEAEIVVVLDGDNTIPLLPKLDNLIVLRNCETLGIRHSINRGIEASHGDFIIKSDAHCIFAYGMPQRLQQEAGEDEVIIPRRYTLNLEDFEPAERHVDYYYLSCPWTYPKGFPMMQSCPWIWKTEYDCQIDHQPMMCFQGSIWGMHRSHWEWMGGLEEGKMTYCEHHEISFKTWLGGRQVKNAKSTWYAHPAERVSGYAMSMSEVYHDHEYSANYWTKDLWPGQIRSFGWLIDKFWPLPTEKGPKTHYERYVWPVDWRKYYAG